MKKCPTCKTNKAQIDGIYGIISCKDCIAKDNKRVGDIDVANVGKLHRIQGQRDHFGKDLLQPFNGQKVNPDFFKVNPDRIDDYGVRHELEKMT